MQTKHALSWQNHSNPHNRLILYIQPNHKYQRWLCWINKIQLSHLWIEQGSPRAKIPPGACTLRVFLVLSIGKTHQKTPYQPYRTFPTFCPLEGHEVYHGLISKAASKSAYQTGSLIITHEYRTPLLSSNKRICCECLNTWCHRSLLIFSSPIHVLTDQSVLHL